ncbi:MULTISPECIES: potassium channel family protein [Dactylosporangium]|uniref:Ion transporter n=2 Tax=Dactylosporangium TaxID=35753 RepID=A0A9W6KRB3_9ACTN|nr:MULTISPECIES: potassium channel family protein [Dactylosporangium]UAB95379.1 potassium channel family protein [Dactylosporangium vinaceum]UWZ43701.1 potassium channel family protein [Dactylosporangium matsuzakiense]GLL05812.1 ion transporter [Dactylosporangium matsuzakiense]
MNLRSDQRADAWERRTAGPLTALAVVFLVAYAVPILRPGLDRRWHDACEMATIAIWALFVGDYAVRFLLHVRRWPFVRGHLFDLAVLLLPAMRPLRVLRLFTAVLVLTRRTEVWARGRLALYVGATSILLIFVAALAVLDAERGSPDANITSYSEALWWACVTITTVGYGDHFPVTTDGRLVAIGLMMGGIGLIGFVTGSLATWIVDRISVKDDNQQDATKSDIALVLAEVQALRAEVAELKAQIPSAAEPTVQ